MNHKTKYTSIKLALLTAQNRANNKGRTTIVYENIRLKKYGIRLATKESDPLASLKVGEAYISIKFPQQTIQQ